METSNRASELNWLQWFYCNTDSDIRNQLKQDFMDDTGLQLPEGYELDE